MAQFEKTYFEKIGFSQLLTNHFLDFLPTCPVLALFTFISLNMVFLESILCFTK